MSTGASAPDLASLADKLLQMVGDRAAPAVTVTHARRGLTRFANSFIHQNVVDEHVEVSLQINDQGRPAAASTSKTDDDALAALADKALRAASLRAVDASWPGLAPPAPLTGPSDPHYDTLTAAAGPAQRADAVAAFVAAGEGLQAAGFCETTVTQRFFANSAGQRVSCRYTGAALDGIHRLGRSDGAASSYSARFSDIDPTTLGAGAAARARQGEGPVELPSGDYEVVLEPRCVAYIMDFFSAYGFNGKAFNENRSFVRPGEAQFDPSLSIWDDATDARHTGPTFDGEGTPKRPVALVEAGMVKNVCHDRRTAAKAGASASSTGHAVPGGESFGAVPTNVFVGPSGAGPEGGGAGPGSGGRPLSELVKDVERGLLVCDLWYTRVLDPKTLVATGLTRNGVFLIGGGEVGPAVSNLRFTQSYAAALAPGNVLGVGDDGQLAGGGLHLGVNYTPSLHLASWHFTGNASS